MRRMTHENQGLSTNLLCEFGALGSDLYYVLFNAQNRKGKERKLGIAQKSSNVCYSSVLYIGEYKTLN